MIKKMTPSESDFAIPAKNCYRMVILGSTKVGKTAIVSRFLSGRFDEQYTPTIEDFHRKLYSIKGDVYQLDILDTSGNHPFPAMRRLSILTGEDHTLMSFFSPPCLILGCERGTRELMRALCVLERTAAGRISWNSTQLLQQKKTNPCKLI